MIFRRLLLAVALFVIAYTSLGQTFQRSDTLKMIAQKWKIKETYVDNFQEDEEEERVDFIKNLRMHFKADMSCVMSSRNEGVHGKWEYNSQTCKITVRINKKGEEPLIFKILSLSYNHIKFESRTEDGELVSLGLLVPVK